MSRPSETGFINHYECPRCGHTWDDEWSCACDDTCPECGCRDVSPYDSDETESVDGDGETVSIDDLDQ